MFKSLLKKIIPKKLIKITKIILTKIHKLARQRTVLKKINGITYKLDLRESIDYQIYKNKSFEPETTEAITNLTKKNMTVIDIGANIGYYTLILAKEVGPEGKIIAFEPMSWAFKKLQKNISLNNFQNIILENKALSNIKEKNKEVQFACSWPEFEDKKNLHPIHKGKTIKNNTDIETLDEYTKAQNIKIDLIKLDVDGYKLKILKGAKQTLTKYKPIIITELGKYTLKEAGDKIEEMIDFLYNLNYKIFKEKTLEEYKDKSEIINSIPKYKTINIIVLPK